MVWGRKCQAEVHWQEEHPASMGLMASNANKHLKILTLVSSRFLRDIIYRNIYFKMLVYGQGIFVYFLLCPYS